MYLFDLGTKVLTVGIVLIVGIVCAWKFYLDSVPIYRYEISEITEYSDSTNIWFPDSSTVRILDTVENIRTNIFSPDSVLLDIIQYQNTTREQRVIFCQPYGKKRIVRVYTKIPRPFE